MNRYNTVEKARIARMTKDLIDKFGRSSEEIVVFIFYYKKASSYNVLRAIHDSYMTR